MMRAADASRRGADLTHFGNEPDFGSKSAGGADPGRRDHRRRAGAGAHGPGPAHRLGRLGLLARGPGAADPVGPGAAGMARRQVRRACAAVLGGAGGRSAVRRRPGLLALRHPLHLGGQRHGAFEPDARPGHRRRLVSAAPGAARPVPGRHGHGHRRLGDHGAAAAAGPIRIWGTPSRSSPRSGTPAISSPWARRDGGPARRWCCSGRA
jgi:hypothetical protein